MQTSSSFRLLSAAVAIFLLAALILVVRFVILSNPAGIPGNALTDTPTSIQVVLNLTPMRTLTSTNPPPRETADSTRVSSISLGLIPTEQPSQTTLSPVPSQTKTIPLSTRVTPTAAKNTRIPTRMATRTPTRRPTKIPIATQTPIPIPTETPTDPFQGQWWLYSNANFVNDLTILGDTIWAATGGGVVALNQAAGKTVKYTSLDGLSHNYIQVAEACLLPGMGVIFGTEAGLQIFDIENERWSTWTSTNSSLFFDDISALYCDAENGFLIIGYEDNGLDILDTIAGTWIHLDDQSILADNSVHHIAVVGDQESIWVASDAGVTGVMPVAGLGENPDSVFYSTLHYDVINSPLETTDITSIAAYEDGTVWMGASNRLYKVQDQNWTIYNSDIVLASEFPTSTILDLSLEADGTLWISSDSGEICHFDPLLEYCIDFFQASPGMATGPLTSLIVAPTGGVLYGTAGNGISIYDGDTWRQQTISYEILTSNAIHDIVQSQDGSIWIATDKGIQRLRAEGGILSGQDIRNSNESENNSLFIGETNTLYPDVDEGIWIGAAGLHYYNGVDWFDYTVEDGLVGHNVQTITMDPLKRMWIGTDVGLSILSDSGFFNLTQEVGLPNDDILAALSVGESTWIGTNGGGLLRFVNNQLQFFNVDNTALPSNVITALAPPSQAGLWVGTDQGLAYFNNNAVTVITELASNTITTIATTATGAVWVGTEEAGVFRFENEEWTQITTADGLPSQQITAILIDQEETVWIGAARGGVVRYVP